MKLAYGEQLVREFTNKDNSKIEITTERFSIQEITEDYMRSTQCAISDISRIEYDLTNNNKPNTIPILLVILGAVCIPASILLAIFSIYFLFIALAGVAFLVYGLIIMKPRFKIEARMHVHLHSTPEPIKVVVTQNVVNILEEVYPIILDIKNDKGLAVNKWATETIIRDMDMD